MRIMKQNSQNVGALPVTSSAASRNRPVQMFPLFATIARKSDFSAEKLAFFLLKPHPKTPNFPLSRNEAGDIAAYIGSLRK
jgi:hypothetical protein